MVLENKASLLTLKDQFASLGTFDSGETIACCPAQEEPVWIFPHSSRSTVRNGMDSSEVGKEGCTQLKLKGVLDQVFHRFY